LNKLYNKISNKFKSLTRYHRTYTNLTGIKLKPTKKQTKTIILTKLLWNIWTEIFSLILDLNYPMRSWIFLIFVKMSTGVHRKSSGTTSEAISLGAEFSTVAGLAVKNSLVTILVGWVKRLVAHTAFETFLVELEVTHCSGLCGVYRFVASGAFDLGGGLERHGGWLQSRY